MNRGETKENTTGVEGCKKGCVSRAKGQRHSSVCSGLDLPKPLCACDAGLPIKYGAADLLASIARKGTGRSWNQIETVQGQHARVPWSQASNNIETFQAIIGHRYACETRVNTGINAMFLNESPRQANQMYPSAYYCIKSPTCNPGRAASPLETPSKEDLIKTLPLSR